MMVTALSKNRSQQKEQVAATCTQTNQHLEVPLDCEIVIGNGPNYSNGYSRLGFVLYAQGKYMEAIDESFKKALQLDPSNESVKGNIESSFWSSNGSIPPFTGFQTNLSEPYDWSSMLADMIPDNSPDGKGNTSVGNNLGDDMSEEINYSGLADDMHQMFLDEECIPC